MAEASPTNGSKNLNKHSKNLKKHRKKTLRNIGTTKDKLGKIKKHKVFQCYFCPSVRPGWSGGVRPSRPFDQTFGRGFDQGPGEGKN